MTSMRRLGRGFEVVLNWLIPRQLLQKREQHMRLVHEKVAQRLATNTDRPDFMDTMVRKEGAMVRLNSYTSLWFPFVLACQAHSRI